MCQAYEGERRAIVASENRASIEGFAVARDSGPKTSNPYRLVGEKYEHDAWNHGWGCYQEGIIPWGLEKLYRERSTVEMAYRMCERFKENKYLCPIMKEIVDLYA